MIVLDQMTSRDFVPMTGITATLASPSNATRIRYPERPDSPTGSVKLRDQNIARCGVEVTVFR
jgi:hypothetical protein